MQQQELIPHLFRTEFSKITAVLCKTFGLAHMETAEDIAGDAFIAALETWAYKGVPANPTAWLYTVAKHKAANYCRRNALFTQKIAPQLQQATTTTEMVDIDLSDENITDSQLQMLFAICHPAISTAAQISLALRVLCGFGVDEIASAFITNKETVQKRLNRAREKLRLQKITFGPAVNSLDKNELQTRLQPVLTTLYLLFSEGYYSESHDGVLREDLCLEAMRLTHLLLAHSATNQPPVQALLALMCFHASRFDARRNGNGELLLYHEQDEGLWNQELIAKGAYFFRQAAQGDTLSAYHLEAGIAFWHTQKADTPEKWQHILQLYNQLLQVAYSPIAALNRTFALAKVKGYTVAITEAEKLQLTNNHFYFTLLGELYKDIDPPKANTHLATAYILAKTQTDKQTIQRMIAG